MFNKRLLVVGLMAATAGLMGCNKKEEAKPVDDSAKLATLEQKANYIIGQNLGKNLLASVKKICKRSCRKFSKKPWLNKKKNKRN
jgi:uncharacterized lipoprotein NlpE involved in copper resistance